MPLSDILSFCEAERDWLLEAVKSLVLLESPSTDKAAVDRCGDEIARRLEQGGAHVRRVEQAHRGNHILARFGDSPAQVLLLGHFDTVWPTGQLDRMPLVERDGRLHGPGVFDMKSGIAVAMLAARALRRFAPPAARQLSMLWTTDEEVGSGTSRALIETEARRASAVLVLEPSLPGGAMKTSRKGCGEFEVVVHGRSAHAGLDPGKGASAIHELARQITVLGGLQDLDRGVSVNVGIIGGGTRPNVVAAEARAVVDVRAVTREDTERLAAAVRSLRAVDAGTRVEVSGGFDRPPLERGAGVVRLYEQAREVAGQLGRELGEGAAGGGSDGNITAALGVPTLDGLGPEGDGAHALHEHVRLGDLAWRAAFVACLVARVTGQTGTMESWQTE